MPLVLVSNDRNAGSRFQWQDITGVQYRYPNNYRNLIRRGEQFIYYRGMRRADGGRGAAEYFGRGTIGEIWRDASIPETEPKGRWAWYCSIVDYVPFGPPVPAKVDGAFFENIPANAWRNGVRFLDDAAFQRIKAATGLPQNGATQPPTPQPKLPPLDDVIIPTTTTELLAPGTTAAEQNGGGGGSGRYSRHASLVGKRAEAIAMRWAARNFPDAQRIRWVSEDGETPGWDIEVVGFDGEITAIEVKGASGAAFANFELTVGELQASRRLGSRYVLLLVADCLGTSPSFHIIKNPWSLFQSRGLLLTPVRFRVSRPGEGVAGAAIEVDAAPTAQVVSVLVP
ncbi:protein of unknown function [Rhizobiales bacterium GAS113]|nr:protein of unknown function [Rhizobiales bacterium GAS113]